MEVSSFFYEIYYLKGKKRCSWRFQEFHMPTECINVPPTKYGMEGMKQAQHLQVKPLFLSINFLSDKNYGPDHSI